MQIANPMELHNFISWTHGIWHYWCFWKEELKDRKKGRRKEGKKEERYTKEERQAVGCFSEMSDPLAFKRMVDVNISATTSRQNCYFFDHGELNTAHV